MKYWDRMRWAGWFLFLWCAGSALNPPAYITTVQFAVGVTVFVLLAAFQLWMLRE